MDGEPRVNSHHLYSLRPSSTSRDSNQRPRACGPKGYGWLSGNKGGASRHRGRSEKAIHKGTNHTCTRNYMYSRKKDLSRRDKLPHAATPIQGESYRPSSTPSFYSYLLTPNPDTTAISGGEKSNEPRMARLCLVIRSLEMTMVSHRGRTGDCRGAGRQEELHLLKSHPFCG